MRPNAGMLVVVLCALAVGALAATSVAQAGHMANQSCPAFRQSGVKYQAVVIGNVTCANAKGWLLKMLTARVFGQSFVHEPIPGAPKGFHCFTSVVKNHVAHDGICYTGTFAYPKNGFTW